MTEQRQLFAVDGLFCGGCARGLEARLKSLDGVIDAGVHFVTASALVRWRSDQCDRSALRRCVAGAGYKLIDQRSVADTAGLLAATARDCSIRLAVAAFFGMWAMAIALVLYLEPDLPPGTQWKLALASGLFALPVLLAGSRLFEMGWRSVRMVTPGIDALIAISAGGATLLSVANLLRGNPIVYFDAATMLVTLRLLGQVVEIRIRGSAIEALRTMEALSPELARPLDGTKMVPIESLEAGQKVVIDAGGPITVDGVIEDGETLVDDALLTGEAIPHSVGPGARVQAGALNLRHRIIVRIDRTAGDRDIDRMGGRVAIEIAGRGERRTDEDLLLRGLATAAPLLMLLAAAMGFMGAGAFEAITRALCVGIVICPCALTIARPLAQLRTVGRAAARGIRVTEPAALANLAAARSAVFDKTGTLTSGELAVKYIEPEPGWTAAEVLSVAAEAETGIDHPLARAIVAEHGREAGPGGLREARSAWAATGRGLACVAGTARSGRETVLDVSMDGKLIGTITMRACTDPAAHGAVSRLRKAGLELRLATGDAPAPAMALALEVGLKSGEVLSECTPGAKADLVRTLPRPVLFVGDGVNDAPALAAADCGIVVARAHPAAASSAAVSFLSGGVEQLAITLSIARRYQRISRQNILTAIGYNMISVPTALLGGLSPVTAAVAMSASSILALANAVR